eukprot:6195943-Pleurochrysis_carterae.AAC.1
MQICTTVVYLRALAIWRTVVKTLQTLPSMEAAVRGSSKLAKTTAMRKRSQGIAKEGSEEGIKDRRLCSVFAMNSLTENEAISTA